MGIEDLNHIDYYIVEFKFAEKSYFTLWYSEDKDEFYTYKGKLLSFFNRDELVKFTQDYNLIISKEETEIRCDLILGWNIDKEINYEHIIDFWNICTDLAYSIDANFLGVNNEFKGIYNKLFHSCKLPMQVFGLEAVSSKWLREELQLLQMILCDGIFMVEKNL